MRYIFSFGYINFLILGYAFQLFPTVWGAKGALGAGGQPLLVGEEDRGVHQQGASPDTPGYNDKKDDDLERPFTEPPTSLKQSFLFLPGTASLTRVSKSNLRRAALWLRDTGKLAFSSQDSAIRRALKNVTTHWLSDAAPQLENSLLVMVWNLGK